MKTFLIQFLFFSAYLFADIIVTPDGTVYKGTIVSADDSVVVIKIGTTETAVTRSSIIAIHFSSADVIYLISGEEITCKIASKDRDNVIVAAADGMRSIPNSSIEKVRYNFRNDLKVTNLPRTDSHFSNISAERSYKENGKSVFLMFHLDAHYASLNDWSKQFYSTNGQPVETSGLIWGAEIGYAASDRIALCVGAESFSTPTLTINQTSPSFEDYAGYTFIYGSVHFGGRPKTLPELFIYGGIDLGSLTGKEVVKNFNGIDFEGGNTKFAQRFKAGMQYMTSNRFSITSEIGYLAANVKEVEVLGNVVPNYSLDFSGLFIRAGFSYHIPLTITD